MDADLSAAYSGNPTQSTPISIEEAGDPDILAGPLVTALHLVERLHPHPLRGLRIVLTRLRNDIDYDRARRAFEGIVAAQPALRHRACAGRDGAIILRPLAQAEIPSLRKRRIDATAGAIENPRTAPAALATALRELRGPSVGGASVQAIWLETSDFGGYLLIALHETIADGWSLALLPRLLDAALSGMPLPRPASLTALMESVAACAPRRSAAAESAAESAANPLHQDGDGDPRQGALVLDATIPEVLWSGIEALARIESLETSAIFATAFSLLVERIAGAPAPMWHALNRRRSTAELATIANATALCRRSASVVASPHVLEAVRTTMGLYLEAGASGASLIPERGADGLYFEWEDDARELRDLHPAVILPERPTGVAVLWSRCLPESLPRWDLKLAVRPPGGADPGGVQIVADKARYREPRLRSLLSAYLALLETIVAEPHRPPADLCLAPRYDRALTWPSGANRIMPPLDEQPRDMATLFAAIARRHATAPAIAWAGGELTFAQVSQMALDLVDTMRRLGIAAGDVVAFRLTTDDSPTDRALFLVAQIATFRLGCAMLPLGQQLPAAQARDQIDALNAALLIVAAPEIDCAPDWASDALDCPAPGFPGAILRRLRNPAAEIDDASSRTSLLFTSSGTTGKPKTIRVSQAMIAGLLRGVDRAGVVPPVPGLMGQNIGFDAIVTDVWLPWLHGCHVVILDTERRTPKAIQAAAALGAKLLSLSPTLAAAALSDDAGCFEGFEMLVLMGEAIPFALARRLEESAPRLLVLNAYGPTENAVWSTLWKVATAGETTIPIGRAIPGYRVLIADPDLRPLPAHWPGEILIASAAPAIGYQDPALTASRFVELPGEEPGPFFRSGDFGWIDDLGRVQFIGRRDRQVKLNGVRVEIDGVEHRIAEVEGVADVGVVVFSPAGQRMQLVAVAQLKPGIDDASALGDRIIEHCRAWLPRAAIPAAIVFVDDMPRGASGKKSYAALRAMLQESGTPAAPRGSEKRATPAPNSIEARIAGLWRDVLRGNGIPVDDIGLTDDLFAIGASSLDALRIAERMERAFGITVPDHQMFVRPTLELQAAFVRVRTAANAEMGAVETGEDSGISFSLVRAATGASRGIVLGMPGLHGDTAPVGVLAARGLGDYDVWACTAELGGRIMWDDTLWLDFARAVAKRMVADDFRPRALIGFSWGAYLSWLVDRLLVAAGREPTPVINLDCEPLHLFRDGWEERIAPHLPPLDSAPPARMLLLYRDRAGRIIVPPPDMPALWARAGVSAEHLHCRTARHNDFMDLSLFPEENAALASFIENGTIRPVLDSVAIDIETCGGAMFRLMALPDPPAPRAVLDLLNTVPPNILENEFEYEFRAGLLFLALACGDAGLAIELADRFIAANLNRRDAVYAKVAVLAQLGRGDEAAALVSRWVDQIPDEALAKRSRMKTMRPASLAGAENLLWGGADLAFDIAAGFCEAEPNA